MNLIGVILCSVATVGALTGLPATASAITAQCASDRGGDNLIREGSTACRATSDAAGRARAIGNDGVGYANATGGASNGAAGALALGVGIDGGAGSAEGAGGAPIALGVGADSLAMTSIPAGSPAPPFALTVAFTGSRAAVHTGDNTAHCLGIGALALDPGDGSAGSAAACLATPFGYWRLR